MLHNFFKYLICCFFIISSVLSKSTLAAKISNCSSCNVSGNNSAEVLENTKTDEEVCKFSKYSAAFKKEVIKRGIDCNNLKKETNVFGKDLGKVKPKDPFFHLKRMQLSCKNKNGKISDKTLMGYISSEYFYAIKISKNIALLMIGYLDETKSNLKIRGIENYFPKKSRSFYDFNVNYDKDIFLTLKKSIIGTNKWNDKCTITSSMKWGGDIVKYEDINFTSKEKKNGLKRAINVLKMFEAKQFDLSQILAQNGFVLGFKFELTDLMTDLTMKLAKLEIAPKVIFKEDKEAKKLAEQRKRELQKEKALRIAEEKERKILEAKTIQLAKEKRLAELNAKKRAEIIAKEVATEEKKKLEEERELRRAEERARKRAEEKAKKIELEKRKAEEKAKKEAKQRAIKLAEERKKTKEIEKRLEKERLLAENKAKKLEKTQRTQLAALKKEKADKQRLILEEKKKRDELEKKLVALREHNKKNNGTNNKFNSINLPPEWKPFQNDMSLQQKQFCQLTNRFFNDIDKAHKSKNEIKVNIVHKERQQNLDGLLPGGKVDNWIFKVVKIEQVEDGSAAVVLSLHCKSFVGSGQVHTKSTWRKKNNKEWRATIPYDDRRFRELAKLDTGQFILGSGTFLEVKAFKPGQIETFYASQQIGEHPLTKDLNLEGELFLADLSYIAALN